MLREKPSAASHIQELSPPAETAESTTRAHLVKGLGEAALPHDVRPEKRDINEAQYPLGYFDAQVRFAEKWSEITGADISDSLLRCTALYRTISGEKPPVDRSPAEWAGMLGHAHDTSNPDDVTSVLYKAFLDQPHSHYSPPHHDGAFGYDYYPDDHVVKVHFTNPVRGESPFSDENMPKRREEFRNLLEYISHTHPDAEKVVSASWIRSTRSYQSLFPADISTPKSMMSTDMFFGGDSLWGQFVDRNGQVNQRVYSQFVQAVDEAKTPEELIEAFPFKVMRIEDPIEKYYQLYQISPDDSATSRVA